MLTLKAMIGRAVAVAAAFVLGWILYMVGMMLTTYDGFVSMVLQPIMATFISGLFVGAAVLVGLLLRLPWFRWWRRGPLAAAALAGTSLGLLAFGYSLGLTWVAVNPDTGSEIVMLHPTAALAGYFSLLFAVANWPVREQPRA